MPENVSLESELKQLCENVNKTKNTCLLYNFQSRIEELLEEKKIKNRELIIECLNSLNDIIPSKLLENLLKKAIELNDTEMCYCIITNVQLLEENHAVDCLKYFLKDDANKNEKLLNTLFVKKFDYRLLTGELKRLSSDQFITCLLYLQTHLKSAFQNSVTKQDDDLDTKMEIECEKSTNMPTLNQTVDLFSCFVDAHFTHITLSSKAQEIIADVLQLIETQLDLFMDLISIESLIKEAKNNSQFKVNKNNNNNIGHYYIEVLKLV